MAIKLNINFDDATGKNFNFTDIDVLLDFAKSEYEFWTKKYEELKVLEKSFDPNYVGTNNVWKNIIDTTNDWKNGSGGQTDETFTAFLKNLNLDWARNYKNYWIFRGHLFVDAWVNSFILSNDTGKAFIQAILKDKKEIQNSSLKFNDLYGFILAYEFIMQGKSTIAIRRSSEEKSITTFVDELFHKKEEIIKEASDLEKDMVAFKQKTEGDFFALDIEHKKIHTKTNNDQITEFQNNYTNWENKIKKLEETYQEKLRYEAPVKHWNKRAKWLLIQGLIWVGLLIIALCLGIYGFMNIFVDWLLGAGTPLNLHHLQGAIIFATILSAFAYLIKVLSKLAFSSFHLQRDAEERAQLTYVYLALLQDGKVDENSRNLVLQALFSRSDSGLLSKESGLTMPSNEVYKSLAETSRV